MSPRPRTRPGTFQSVVLIITRDGLKSPRLLVLGESSAGYRLPVGAIHFNEHFDQAAKRVAIEKLGFVFQAAIRHLGTTSTRLPDTERVVLRMTKLFSEPSYDSSSEGYGLSRGDIVVVGDEIDGFTQITEFGSSMSMDRQSNQEKLIGYVRRSLLGRSIDSHLVHLPYSNDELNLVAPAEIARAEQTWVDLFRFPEIVAEHREWLNQVKQTLVNYFT